VNGQFVYNGPFDGLLDQLDSKGFPCPPYTSPADYVLQIASGEQGIVALNQMTEQSRLNRPLINQFSRETRPLSELTAQPKFPNWIHFRLLFKRSFLLNLRDPMLTSSRLLSHIVMAFFIGWLFGPLVGSYSNCPPRLGTHYLTFLEPPKTNFNPFQCI
jgi:hypothetical protein